MSDAAEGVGRTNRPPDSTTTARQFADWCDQEQERRRARDLGLDERLFNDAVELVLTRLAAKERWQ
jgi:hypothetical protein